MSVDLSNLDRSVQGRKNEPLFLKKMMITAKNVILLQLSEDCGVKGNSFFL